MSDEEEPIDLCDSDENSSSKNSSSPKSSPTPGTKRRREEEDAHNEDGRNRKPFIPKVFLVIHRLEANGVGCVGDFSSDGRDKANLSHCPTTFDSNVIGIYTSLEQAEEVAEATAEVYDIEQSDEGDYFKGDFEDTNTFSERIFIEHRTLDK